MLGLHLVHALDESWREPLDDVARERGWPTTRDAVKLGARVAELSAAYNDPERARATVREAGAARLGFAFARDVPKGAAAVRELVSTGQVRLTPGETLRVLDVGAGLGAMTWGLVRALAASGASGRVEAAWVDPDREALRLGEALLRRRSWERGIELAVNTAAESSAGLPGRAYDVVLVGNVLSELHVGASASDRVSRHVAFLRDLLDRAERALVVVEPALRDRTRHLHAVRDALVAGGGVEVFAPCLHAAPCPALERELDWCHEDLPVDLPAWLVPVARAAGLRREGLTFSYLVLKKSGPTLATLVARPPGARLRVVSGPIPSKGKHEAFLCGEFRAGASGTIARARARTARLDRDRSASNAAWDELRRGDVFVVEPAPDLDRPRVVAGTRVMSTSADESRVTHPGDSETR
jgi:ribosomal protein RSM22 (predicted rRNA methylase)